MECVPSVLLESILSYLSIDEVVVVRRTCRRVRALPWDLWINSWEGDHTPDDARHTKRSRLMTNVAHEKETFLFWADRQRGEASIDTYAQYETTARRIECHQRVHLPIFHYLFDNNRPLQRSLLEPLSDPPTWLKEYIDDEKQKNREKIRAWRVRNL